MVKEKVSIRLEDGSIITRKPRFQSHGNFVMAIIRYMNEDYLLGDWEGDEYLRGVEEDKVYKLGLKLD